MDSKKRFAKMSSVVRGCKLIPGDTVIRAFDDRGAKGVDDLVKLGLGRFNLRLHRTTTAKTGPTRLRGGGAGVLKAICHVLILALNRPISAFA